MSTITLTVKDSNQGGGGPVQTTSQVNIIGRTFTLSGPTDYQLDMNGEYMFIGGVTINSDTLDGTAGRHGGTLNPIFQGDHGWDDRLFYQGGGPSAPTGLKTLYDVNARVTFPLTLSPGDSVTFMTSNASVNTRGQHGDYATIHCIATALDEPAKYLAPCYARGHNNILPPAVSSKIDLDAKLASLPVINWNGPDVAPSTILNKVSRPYPLSAFTRVDTNPGGCEASIPNGFRMTGSDSGYSRSLGRVWATASRLVLNANNSTANRKQALGWLMAHGRDYFMPQYNDIDNLGNNGGGHFGGHQIPAMWYLWGTDQMQLLKDYGTPTQFLLDNIEQYALLNTQMVADLNTPHDNANLPWCSRRRDVTQLDLTPGNETITFQSYSSEPVKRCAGMILRKDGDPNTSYGQIIQNTNQSGNLRFTPTANTPNLSVGDTIYLTAWYTPKVGQAVWAIGGFKGAADSQGGYNSPSDKNAVVTRRTYGRAQSTYMPSTTGYRSFHPSGNPHYWTDQQNQFVYEAAFLAGVFGVQDEPIWAPVVDMFIYSERNYSGNWPGPFPENIQEQMPVGFFVDGTWQNIGNWWGDNARQIFGDARFDKSVGWGF